jgi:hypothetical protein
VQCHNQLKIKKSQIKNWITFNMVRKCLFTHFIHLVSLLSFLWFCLLLPLRWKRPLSPYSFWIMILSFEYWVFKTMYVSLNDKQQTMGTSSSWQESCICIIFVTFRVVQSDKSSYDQPCEFGHRGPGFLEF